MKQYLIKITAQENNHVESVRYNSDNLRPYQIAGNLWCYEKIGYAARCLEMLAQSWEKHGFTVLREYGSIKDVERR